MYKDYTEQRLLRVHIEDDFDDPVAAGQPRVPKVGKFVVGDEQREDLVRPYCEK